MIHQNSHKLLLFFLFFFNTLASSQVIYVKFNGNGDGRSWAQAQGNLRQAIFNAPKGSQIWVAAGTYTPTKCTNCTDADRRLSFEMPDSIAIYGGFLGTETMLSQRNCKTNQTVLSGNIDSDTTAKNNSFNVIYTRNVTKSTIIDGFIITDGNANDLGSAGERTTSGGGWYNDGRQTGNFANPSVKNCIFEKNQSRTFGAAIMNNATFGGHCEPEYQHCDFRNNISGQEGGAIRNTSAFGGICRPKFSFCQFINNYSGAAGGAIFNDGINGVCNPVLTNCRFIKNKANTYGGAIYNLGKNGDASPKITNCLFWGNKAVSAAAIYCLGSENGNSSPLITNCVFYKNEANTCGSIYANANDATGKSSPLILNCIIWGNIATTAPFIRSIESSPKIDYSIIDAPVASAVFRDNVNGQGVCGTHVLFNQNPLFSDPDNGDFRLIPPSPAINSGIDSAAVGLLVDIDSFPRIIDGQIDMGILEYNRDLSLPPHVEQSPMSHTACEGDVVVLKARFSGSSPLYFQWYKNGVAVPNATTDSLKFINGITLSDSGSYHCTVRNLWQMKDSSAVAVVKTKPLLPLSIQVVADHAPKCEGDSITFSSIVQNGGTQPQFDWWLNDQSLGLSNNLNVYTGMVNSVWFRYTCRVTSSEQCTVPQTAVSNELQYTTILPRTAVGVHITANRTEICDSDTLTLTAHGLGGGETPQYQWLLNGSNISAANAIFYKTNKFRNGDKVSVQMVSSEICPLSKSVLSDEVVIKSNLCTGIFEENEQKITISPNPSTEPHLIISGLTSFTGDKIVTVFNSNGQILLSKSIKEGIKEAVLDLEKPLTNGLYGVKITTHEHHFYKKWLFVIR